MPVKFNSATLPACFVSIAVRVENRVAHHAAILIRYRGVHYLHHYPGSTKPEVVEDFDEDGWYVYKIVEQIDSADETDVAAFLQHCRRVCAKSNITYGYIADGSTYDDRGEFISRIGLPEFGTCVGFCANTLSSVLEDVEEGYFDLDDWDDSEIIPWVDVWGRKEALRKYPNLDWSLYNAFKKRIPPIDYLCSAFLDSYPIKKRAIDRLRPGVQARIEELF
jgi:hypothetical protein